MTEFFAEVEFLACPATQVAPFAVELDWVHEIEHVPQQTYLDWMASAGFTSGGLPVGLQLVGRRRADWDLLRMARAVEAATGYGSVAPDLPRLA